MRFPVSSRMTVQGATWSCLTSVFGMGTGDPTRYGRPTTSVRPTVSGLAALDSVLDAYAAFWKQKAEVNRMRVKSAFNNVRMDVS